MDKLFSEMSQCTRCPLHRERQQVVLPTWPAGVSLVFIGEAPGKDEEKQGRGFVGRAGQLLREALHKTGIEGFAVSNCVKCRPRDGNRNRPPTDGEIAACVPWLKEEIAHQRPKVAVLLGNSALQGIFPHLKGQIGKLHGQVIAEESGTLWYAMYHPSSMIYNRNKMTPIFYTDLEKLKSLLA